MSEIPTKDELARNKADKDAAAARQREDQDFERYKAAIIAGMRAGDSSYRDRIGNVSPAVQQRLRNAFGSQWTLVFSNARTGCSISWS